MNIAITGGIGCGKSAVIAILRRMGKHCISCDEINAALLEEEAYIAKIKEEFPSIIADGKINKKALGELIFLSPTKRKKLNSIAHPIIKERMLSLFSDREDNFVEIPLLTTEDAKIFDQIWDVNCDYQNRVERIMLRDNIDSDYARRKIAVQKETEGEFVATATIMNNNNIHNLEKHVEYLLENI